MSTKNTNKLNVPQARAAMDKFKMEAASEVGVNLKEGYNGDLTSREAGSVGGQMVKKMIESYEKNLKPYTHSKRRQTKSSAASCFIRMREKNAYLARRFLPMTHAPPIRLARAMVP